MLPNSSILTTGVASGWSLPGVFPQTLRTEELIQELGHLYTTVDLQLLDHVELVSRYLRQVRPKPKWEVSDFPPASRPFIQEIIPEGCRFHGRRSSNLIPDAASLDTAVRKREHHQINAKSVSKLESATKRPKITWP
ncbi:uncharacterized protein LOC131880931 [Tigriopus californicus]|uniref:uncharacterized protein LOC131880931 n=1 Tax=Tigriopus californicus TaxID=6832 RepID=UPI0027DA7DD3|nr:uncharacterized protein LOC131880931 [Tigriopus californicus]